MAELERVAHFDGEGLGQPMEVLRVQTRFGHAPIHDYQLRPFRESDGITVRPAMLSLEGRDKGLAEMRQRHGFTEWDQERNVWYPDAILHLHEVDGRKMPVKQAAMLTFAALSAAPKEWAQVGLIRKGESVEGDESFSELERVQAKVMNKWDNINLVADPGYVGSTRDIQGFAAHALRMHSIYIARYLPNKEGSAA